MALRISVFVGLVLSYLPAIAFAGERPVVVEQSHHRGVRPAHLRTPF